MGRGPGKTSFQKRHRDANRHMERFSTLFIIREMQFKTTMKYHLTLVRMSFSKKTNNNKCGQECEERGALIHFWWECKLCSPLWKTVWRYLKKRCGFHVPLPASFRLSPPWIQKYTAFLNAHCYQEGQCCYQCKHIRTVDVHTPQPVPAKPPSLPPVAALPSPPLPGLSPPAIQVTRAWTPVSFLHLWSDLWLHKPWSDKLLGGLSFPPLFLWGNPLTCAGRGGVQPLWGSSAPPPAAWPLASCLRRKCKWTAKALLAWPSKEVDGIPALPVPAGNTPSLMAVKVLGADTGKHIVYC